jgi:hypothetical protein
MGKGWIKMGRDEHRHKRGKTKLPQTPAYEKETDGVDMEMAEEPKVQFGIAENRNNRD